MKKRGIGTKENCENEKNKQERKRNRKNQGKE
jgi:hypothetical protein